MVSQICKDRNIMYIGDFVPRNDLDQASNSNIFQGGIPRTTNQDEIQRLKAEIADVKRKRTELMAEFGAEYIKLAQKQAAVLDTNVKQAGLVNTKSDKEVLDTMLNFINGDSTGGYQPPAIGMVSDNPQQSSLKQAGIHKKKASDVEMLNNFLQFSGLS